MNVDSAQLTQINFIKSISLDSTNEWLSQLSDESINEFAQSELDVDSLSKLFQLPQIENPLGTGNIWQYTATAYSSPLVDTQDAIEYIGKIIVAHLLLAAILLDKGSEVIASDEQEGQFIRILNQLSVFDTKYEQLNAIALVFCKKIRNNTELLKMNRQQIFAFDVLFKHACNFVDSFVLFENDMPQWWRINKLVISSKGYLSSLFESNAQCISNDLHHMEDMLEIYPELPDGSAESQANLSVDMMKDVANYFVFNKAFTALTSIKVCPDVLKLFNDLSLFLKAKPKSANKKANHKLIDELRSQNLVSFEVLKHKKLIK